MVEGQPTSPAEEIVFLNLDDKDLLGKVVLKFATKETIAVHLDEFWVFRFGGLGSIPRTPYSEIPVYGAQIEQDKIKIWGCSKNLLKVLTWLENSIKIKK